MIAAARTRKRVVSDIAPEEGWASVDDAIGEAIDVTKITDEVDDEIDEVNDEIDDVVEIKLDEVVEISWDDVIEEIAVVTNVMELAPARSMEDGKLSSIVT